MATNSNDAAMNPEGKSIRCSISLPESFWAKIDELKKKDEDCEGVRSRLIRKALRQFIAAGTPDGDSIKAARQA